MPTDQSGRPGLTKEALAARERVSDLRGASSTSSPSDAAPSEAGSLNGTLLDQTFSMLQTSFGWQQSTGQVGAQLKVVDQLTDVVEGMIEAHRRKIEEVREECGSIQNKVRLLLRSVNEYETKHYYRAEDAQGQPILKKKHINMQHYDSVKLKEHDQQGNLTRVPVWDETTQANQVDAQGNTILIHKEVDGYRLKEGIDVPEYYPQTIYPGKSPQPPAHYPDELPYTDDEVYRGESIRRNLALTERLTKIINHKSSFLASSFGKSNPEQATETIQMAQKIRADILELSGNAGVMVQRLMTSMQDKIDELTRETNRASQLSLATSQLKDNVSQLIESFTAYAKLIQRPALRISTTKPQSTKEGYVYNVVNPARRVVGKFTTSQKLKPGYYPVSNFSL